MYAESAGPAVEFAHGQGARYVPVDPCSLDEGSAPPCDLYARVAPTRYVLFVPQCETFDAAAGARLRARKIRRLYVRDDEDDHYARYLLGRMDQAANDPNVTSERRAQVAYEGTSFMLRRVFDGPRAQSLTDLEGAVRLTVGLAIREPRSTVKLVHLSRHDTYTYHHSLSVGVFGTVQALHVGSDPAWQHSVAQGLFLHDIGKTRVPLDILNYPGRLSEEQWRTVRKHPTWGVEILDESGHKDPVVRTVVEHHHERDDGSGYPSGLKNGAIAVEAKICMLADVFDALTSERPYRKAMCTYDALEVMVRELGPGVEPELFEAFVRLFEEGRQPGPTSEAVAAARNP
jgi:putative nucleotidyltransferase with HDIG domain